MIVEKTPKRKKKKPFLWSMEYIHRLELIESIQNQKKERRSKDSGVATIQAGENLSIQADSLTNYVSRIVANKNLAITSSQVNNIAADHQITTIKDGDLMEYYHYLYIEASGGGGDGSTKHETERTTRLGDYHEEIIEIGSGI